MTDTAPVPTVERIIRKPLEGGGHLDASETALRNLQREEGAMRARAATVQHPAEIARETAEREAEAEVERKASDPRAVLHAAHQLRAEAEVERLRVPVERARGLVSDLEPREREHQATARARQAAAAEALTQALAAGDPVLPLIEALEGAADPIAAELATARAALVELERQATTAADRLTRCGHGVARTAVAVLTDQAADEANEIIAAAGELHRRRADLEALTELLTAEGRRLNGQPPLLPAQISRALYPPDRTLTGADRGLAATNWAAKYAELRDPQSG